jgi:hypothetical protein
MGLGSELLIDVMDPDHLIYPICLNFSGPDLTFGQDNFSACSWHLSWVQYLVDQFSQEENVESSWTYNTSLDDAQDHTRRLWAHFFFESVDDAILFKLCDFKSFNQWFSDHPI